MESLAPLGPGLSGSFFARMGEFAVGKPVVFGWQFFQGYAGRLCGGWLANF